MKHLSKKIHATRRHVELEPSAENLEAKRFVNAFQATLEILTNVAVIQNARSIPTAHLRKLVPTINASIHV